MLGTQAYDCKTKWIPLSGLDFCVNRCSYAFIDDRCRHITYLTFSNNCHYIGNERKYKSVYNGTKPNRGKGMSNPWGITAF